MIHIRIDDYLPNAQRKFACGLGPDLPEGDTYFYAGIIADADADCPGCNPNPKPIGTPLSELQGRNGGNGAWRAISESWGYP